MQFRAQLCSEQELLEHSCPLHAQGLTYFPLQKIEIKYFLYRLVFLYHFTFQLRSKVGAIYLPDATIFQPSNNFYYQQLKRKILLVN